MDTKQIEGFRQQLIEQRERIAAGWDQESDEAEVLRDPEELATLITRSEVDDQLAEDDLNLLRKIDFALQRLDAGTYDRCASCGNEIPLARLQAKPSVSLCLACQEAKDASGE